jgi:hypothetical protein
MVVDASLRALHPVHNTSSIGIGHSRSPNRNPRIAGPPLKLFGRVRLRPSHDPVYEAQSQKFYRSKNAARRPHSRQNQSYDHSPQARLT